MIKLYFPNKYELISGNLFISDPDSKYKTDPIYEETSDVTRYEKFLNELFQIAKPAQKRFFDTVKSFILNYTVCVSSPLDSPSYYYTRNRIIINLPDSKLDRIALILGSTFFYIVGTMKPATREIYIPNVSLITAFLVTKISLRPIDFKELSPRVIQYIIAWYLKKYNKLTPQNLSKYSVKAGKGFVSPKELREVYDTINGTQNVDELFDLLGNLLSINTFKQAFSARFGIDIMLTFDDFAHLLYNTASALYLNYPSILNQYISKSIVRKNGERIASSIATRLYKLPKY